MEPPEPGELSIVSARNKMGLLGGISYIVGNIVGAGIFITPATILANAGSVGFSLFIWVFTAGVAMLGAFSYIELGTTIRESGCDFAYYCYVRWYPLAFCYMSVATIVHYPAVVAVQVQTFSQYFFAHYRDHIEGKCVNDTGSGWMSIAMARKLVETGLIVLLVFLNFFSLRRFVARFNIIASVAKVIAASCIIGIGFYYLVIRGQTQHFSQPFQGTIIETKHLISALFAGLFSYDGWDILNFGAEEITHPRRNLPLAIVIGMGVICAIYLSINVAYFTVLSKAEIVANTAVADTFVRNTIGPSYSFLMPIAVCALLVGSLNGTIFQSSRLMHSASRGGHLPAFISCTHGETDSPRAALVVTLILVVTMNAVGDVHILLNYIGFAQWSQRGITMLVLFWIRYKGLPASSRGGGGQSKVVRAPLGVPIAFFAICTVLTVLTIIEDTKSAILGLIVYFVALTAYMTLVYERALPSNRTYKSLAGRLDSSMTSILQVALDAMPQRMKMLAMERNGNAVHDSGRTSKLQRGAANGNTDANRSNAKGEIRILEKALYL